MTQLLFQGSKYLNNSGSFGISMINTITGITTSITIDPGNGYITYKNNYTGKTARYYPDSFS